MKKILLKILILVSLQLQSLFGQPGINTSKNDERIKNQELVDERDGKIYSTVLVDSTIWMTQNLAFEPSNGKYWIFRNDKRTIEDFGYLYNWETAQSVCPEDWRLPTKDDFQNLILSYKEQNIIPYRALVPEGISGIDIYSPGVKYGASYVYVEGNSILWTSSENGKKKAWGFSMEGRTYKVDVYPTFFKKSGIPVRCIKDIE